METSNKNEEKKKKNKNKILLCGLISGVLTKTIFAPFDRIKLLYQIQPMFYHNKKRRRYNLKNRKEFINNNLLLNGLGDTKINIENSDLNIVPKKETKRFIRNENVVFQNFKNSLNEITKINKKKGGNNYRKGNKLNIYINDNATKSFHHILKKFLFDYKKKSDFNNLNKNYKFLNNSSVKHMLRNKFNYLNGSKLNNQSFKYRNIIQSFIYIIREEGLIGLWKGNLINMIRGGIVYSAKFGTNDIIKENYKKKKENQENGISSINKIGLTINNNIKKVEKVKKRSNFNYYESLIAGYASGVIQKTASYPLDLLSIRMALGINEKYLRNSMLYKKKSIFKVIREIINNEGFAGFFKGFCPTLLTGVPYVTLQMLFFDFYKNIFENHISYKSNSVGCIAFFSSIAGSLSNLTSLIIVFPGDTVRKRMMNNGIDNKNFIYKNTFHCIRNIYYHEGFKNFYFGLFPSMLKAIPSGAIQFMSYEVLKYFLSQN